VYHGRRSIIDCVVPLNIIALCAYRKLFYDFLATVVTICFVWILYLASYMKQTVRMLLIKRNGLAKLYCCHSQMST